MTIDFRASQVQTNKIISSGSTGTEAKLLVYPITSQNPSTPNQGQIGPNAFSTSSIGSDVFLYVSGAVGSRNISGSHGVTVFGGDVLVSGNLAILGTSDVSGSTKPDNFSYKIISNGVTVLIPQYQQMIFDGTMIVDGDLDIDGEIVQNDDSKQAWSLIVSGGAEVHISSSLPPVSGQILRAISANEAIWQNERPTRIQLGSYQFITASISTTQSIGANYFNKTEHNSGSCILRSIVKSIGLNTASIQLYNLTSGTYVHIGGPGVLILSSTQTIPTKIESVNLYSAINFSTASIYELKVYSSTPTPEIIHYNSEFITFTT